MKRISIFAWAILISLFLFQASADAALIAFDFNSLSDGATNIAVKNYMNTVLASINMGTVNVIGSRGEKNYTGDDYVVGPVVQVTPTRRRVVPLTLGHSDGTTQHLDTWDTYLVNSGSDRITMTFTKPIYHVNFDYEIFPDGTCPTPSCNASNWPDFTFKADGILQFRKLAELPINGLYPHSPHSGINGVEVAPQFLGTSGDWFFKNGVTSLEFVDWPRMIGVDNLNVDFDRPPDPNVSTPEPATATLFMLGLAVPYVRRRFKR